MTTARATGPLRVPKKSPVVTTPTRFHTSVTERASFRTCRRRWFLENVERLQPKGRVTWYLIFGDCIHAAMDAYYRPKRGTTTPPRDLKRALAAFKKEWNVKDIWLRNAYEGFYTHGIEEEWLMHRERGETMLKHYHTFDRVHPFFDSVIEVGVEDRGFIDILEVSPNDPNHTEHLPDLPLLSGRIDLVVEKSDGIWIVDHKALASPAWDRGLDVDDQLTGYCYMWWRLTGEIPRGAMYNVLIKDPPKPPRQLKDGSLSRDKAQRTTFELYVEAINELNLDMREYEEHLHFLSEKGWGQFFQRMPVQRNLEELLSFEQHLFYEHEDMKEALEREEKRYHNASQYTCPGCPVMSICQSMEEQGNVEYVKENGYEVQEPRTIIPKSILSEKWEGV